MENKDNTIIVGNSNTILYVYSVLMQKAMNKEVILTANKINCGKLVDAVEILKMYEDFDVSYASKSREIKDINGRTVFSSLLDATITFK
jgi:DNA-binding protein